MEAHASDYTSDKHRKQWPATLEAYAYPVIGNMLVADIAMRDVKRVLEQETTTKDGRSGKLWFVKTETAKRLLGRIKTVLDFASAHASWGLNCTQGIALQPSQKSLTAFVPKL